MVTPLQKGRQSRPGAELLGPPPARFNEQRHVLGGDKQPILRVGDLEVTLWRDEGVVVAAEVDHPPLRRRSAAQDRSSKGSRAERVGLLKKAQMLLAGVTHEPAGNLQGASLLGDGVGGSRRKDRVDQETLLGGTGRCWAK